MFEKDGLMFMFTTENMKLKMYSEQGLSFRLIIVNQMKYLLLCTKQSNTFQKWILK